MAHQTIAPEQLPPATDPWLATQDTELHYDVAPALSSHERDQFDKLVAGYDAGEAITAITTPPDTAPDHKTRATIEFTPTPAAEIERRARANMAANFALAHTLRGSNPELLRQNIAATAEPVTETIKTHPEKYQGRHRRIGRFALSRLFRR
jgi:hypothetical protein